MIDYITRSELRAFAAKISQDEQVRIRRSAANRTSSGATFLSHSSKDSDLVIGATKVLEGHGASVYIDEIDPAMPPYTSEETASILKQRIYQANRFVLLASKNSQDSRWVPWELGIADGAKGMDQIALFPASDTSNEKSWAQSEYLGLYRRIVWGNLEGHKDPLWMVLDEKRNTAVTLSIWLRAKS